MKKLSLILLGLAVVVGAVVYTGNNKNVENMSSNVEATAATEASTELSPISVGMSGGYKPYTFIDENNELTGFDVEVWKELGKRLGREVQFETADFSGLFGLLDTNKITTIANQITVNEKRLEKYDFADPYVYYGAQLVVKGDNDSVIDLETLKGKKVGVSLGSNYEEMVKAFDVNDEIEVITYESYQASLQDVSLGRIDAVLNDKLAGVLAIKESGLNLKLGGEPVELMFNAFPFVKSEENTVFIQDVNAALKDMREDGTLEAISTKWFEINITEK